MKTKFFLAMVFTVSSFIGFLSLPVHAEDSFQDPESYKIGPDDMLEISILQPDKLTTLTTVSPDGSINFPYVGRLDLKELTLSEAQEKLQRELSDYLQFPVVSVLLRESKSRTFYVYGEVVKPGSFQADQSLTLIRGISMAGGFTKYGAAGQAVILRQKPDGSGSETIKANIKAILDGDTKQDIKIMPRDVITVSAVYSEEESDPNGPASDNGYKIGVDDVLLINILQPEPLSTTLTVSPDGTVTFPYIGNVAAKDKSLMSVQKDIQTRLGNFMQNPVVSVSLKESKSRTFYVYGEVMKPGPYQIQDGLTAIRAISMAGGFTKYGSANNVKILRYKADKSSDETIKVDVKAAMDGDGSKDIKIEPGDVISVQESMF